MHNFSVPVFSLCLLVFVCIFFGLSFLTKKIMRLVRDYKLATELAMEWWFVPRLNNLEESIFHLFNKEDDVQKQEAYNELLGQIDTFEATAIKNKTVTELREFIIEIESARNKLELSNP